MTHASTLARSPAAASAERAVNMETMGDRRWSALYRVAGGAALLTALLIPLQIVAFVVWPPPTGGVTDWFELFQQSPLIGLVSFDLAILIEEALLIPVIGALYLLLHRRSESLMVIATGFWLVSVALFIGSNTGFEMLALAGRYAEATSDLQRAMFAAAGQTMLSSYMEQGSSFVVGYSFASIAGILVGIAMLRATVFPMVAGWAAIVANVLGFALFIPGIGVAMSIGSVLILLVWYALIGWRMVTLRPRRSELAAGD